MPFNFSLPDIGIAIAELILAGILIKSILDLWKSGKEWDSIKRVGALIVVLALFVDGITGGRIFGAIGDAIARVFEGL